MLASVTFYLFSIGFRYFYLMNIINKGIFIVSVSSVSKANILISCAPIKIWRLKKGGLGHGSFLSPKEGPLTENIWETLFYTNRRLTPINFQGLLLSSTQSKHWQPCWALRLPRSIYISYRVVTLCNEVWQQCKFTLQTLFSWQFYTTAFTNTELP